MNKKLILRKLFAYSETNNKYFYTEFTEDVNIIYGKNTSGKSTIFQVILYTLGINDNSDYLKEILEEDVIFRLDSKILTDQKEENISFIRDGEILFIIREKFHIVRFNGISADNSAEHIKLKEYLHDLFGFSLKLERKNEYKAAPIETMWLPYYVSQAVGWVYLRKSFSSLEFYKNFKEDYLDYYVGITSLVDREKKQELEKKLKNKEEEIKFYTKMEKNNDDFKIAKLVDEKFIEESKKYIETYKENQRTLFYYEEMYASKCNEQSYFKRRLSLLQKISNNHKKQNPIGGKCPSCNQTLKSNLGASYKYFQEQNDTEEEKKKYKEKIKKLQSELNSLIKKMDNKKQEVFKAYEVLRKYYKYNISYDTWIENKINVQMVNNIENKVGKLTIEKLKIEGDLKNFKTEEEVEKLRVDKNNEFTNIFSRYLEQLKVKPLKEERYKSLYKISAFPYQGVELHKTVLAYNFAFNRLIQNTNNIHRFPFMLDAIFKEDIEQSNKNAILKFIGKNIPADTQLIISIAETKENKKNIDNYNKKYFNGQANLICIGGGVKVRAFLDNYNGSRNSYLEETLNVINGDE